MMDRDVPRIESSTDIWRLRCRRCGGYFYLAYSILDSLRGNTVDLYRCGACEEYIWDDGAKLIRGVQQH